MKMNETSHGSHASADNANVSIAATAIVNTPQKRLCRLIGASCQGEGKAPLVVISRFPLENLPASGGTAVWELEADHLRLTPEQWAEFDKIRKENPKLTEWECRKLQIKQNEDLQQNS